MGLKVTESFVFGGVDSRSNPVNYPSDRSLRVRNFLLTRDGHIRLRDGYTAVAMESPIEGNIHSLISYKVIGGNRYLVIVQGRHLEPGGGPVTEPARLYLMDLASGAVTEPTVRGKALAGTGRWSWYLAFNRLHGTNGVDKKFFDGQTWRDIGLRAPTIVEAAAVQVSIGAIHVGAVPKSTVGGAQPGYKWFIAFWNRVTGAVSNRIQVGGRLLFTDNDHEVGFLGLPSHEDSEVDLIIGRTGDGAEVPHVVTDLAGIKREIVLIERSSGLVNCKVSGDSPIVGQSVTVSTVGDSSFNGTFTVTAIQNLGRNPNAPPGRAGTNSYWQISWNQDGTNIISQGGFIQWVSGEQTEDWVYVPNGQNSATITSPSIDGAAELPTRNSQPPDNLIAVARVGDYVHGITSDGPWCYRTEIGVDDLDGHVGRPEQNWPATTETFPTGETPIAVHGYNGDAWYHTSEDLAIMVDQEGVPGWQGPWQGAGIAGQDAFCAGWKGLPFWVSGHKQLWTMTAEGPIAISDEYEAALLAQIGDAFLSETQVVPYRDAEKKIEILAIRAHDKEGDPFIVIHDFNAADSRSPYGQATEIRYGNALADDFDLANIRDKDSHARLWAAGSDGHIYQLFDGLTDNGDEFIADNIGLLYIGPDRKAVKDLEWYGDSNVEWYWSKTLDKTADVSEFTALRGADENGVLEEAERVPSDEDNPHWRIQIPDPEAIHCYLWMRLRSHSADAAGNGMALNDPPHMPLESYGRVYMVSPITGTSRGK